MHSIHQFSTWLSGTALSMTIQDISWIIPAVQTVHILSIAIVMSSVFVVDLHLIGVFARGQPTAALVRRFIPWVWYTLIVLFLSGSTLIIGEPGRSLGNPAFLAKMIMLVSVIVITMLLQRPLRKDPAFWEISIGRRATARIIAVASMSLWVGIVCAGRWIAYVGST